MILKSSLSSLMVALMLLAACRGSEARTGGRGIDAGTQGDDLLPSQSSDLILTLEHTPQAGELGGSFGSPGDQTTGGTTGGIEPTIPPTAIDPTTISVDARGSGAEGLDAAWQQIAALDQGVTFRLNVTEAELEAAILMAMQEQGYGANIADLNVSLENGQIGLSFIFTPPDHTDRQVPASVLYNASINANGNLVLAVASAEVGRFELPPELLSAFDQALAEGITGAASSAEADITLTNLVIANGEMTIEGRIKQ